MDLMQIVYTVQWVYASRVCNGREVFRKIRCIQFWSLAVRDCKRQKKQQFHGPWWVFKPLSICKQTDPISVIKNAVSVTIAVSVAIGKNRLNAEVVFHIALKTRFSQLKNLSDAAVSSRIGHILNHCPIYTYHIWFWLVDADFLQMHAFRYGSCGMRVMSLNWLIQLWVNPGSKRRYSNASI